MSSNPSNTNNDQDLSWGSSIQKLSRTQKPSQNVLKLLSAGHETLEDLARILPLRTKKAPKLQDFSQMKEGELFLGKAQVIDCRISPAFGRKGKGRVQLFNINAMISDELSQAMTSIKFFNAYPNIRNQVKVGESILFLGDVKNFKGQLHIVNPKINPKDFANGDGEDSMLVDYPTINGVPGKYIRSLIEKIPQKLWSMKFDKLQDLNLEGLLMRPIEALAHLHTIVKTDQNMQEKAKQSLIYHDFFLDCLKINARRQAIKQKQAPVIEISNQTIDNFVSLFPYELTPDQIKAIEEIRQDLKSQRPMMRMIQGDVGCGKTTVAIVSALMAAANNAQVALMCPTETLALQHYQNFCRLLPSSVKIAPLLGGQKTSEKNQILQGLVAGEIDIVIGTHSLIQDSCQFKNLQLAIIDEQHKFGVEQRLKLASKGKDAQFIHSLIMSATPIPRTLQLAQYGDLDITTIRTLPSSKKAAQTRIVKKETYEKYLSFLKTRVELGEQVYIVAPAIEESESLDIKSVQEIAKQYRMFFPKFSIEVLHGRLKAEEKNEIFTNFANGDIQILISTTVIEVGVDVHNATVISIYNPDRFGLSALHQLRGRVGRGSRPGFCFLVTGPNTPKDSLERLKVIESNHDGFAIAQADLKHRGAGDLFGVEQSGASGAKRIGNLWEHLELFEKAQSDVAKMLQNCPQKLNPILDELAQDYKVSSTI